MLVNSELTLYHKILNTETRKEQWIRYSYDNVWFYGGKGAGINKGYENANDVSIRIPYDLNKNLNFNNFAIGDIVVKGNISLEIETQQDLLGYEYYNITSLVNNTYGINKHINIGGK